MNKQILLILSILAGILHSLAGYSQLHIGSGGLHIKAGATILLSGLQIQPTGDIQIENNTLQYSHIPLPGTPHASIKRVYSWTSAIQSKGLIGIYVPISDLNGNNFNLLQLAYNPTSSVADYVVSTNSVATASNQFVFETMPLITWKQLTSVEQGSTLPLHLIFLKTQKTPKSITLYWQTTNELQIESYNVLRSSDARNFSPIGQVTSTCNGCNLTNDYQFEDMHPIAGKNYYKLQIKERHGTSSYSDVVMEQWKGGVMNIIISPNPTKGLFAIQGLKENSEYDLRVTTSTGKLIFSHSITTKSTNYKVDASRWATGIYYIHLRDTYNGEWKGKLLKR